MEKAIKVINELKRKRLIRDYELIKEAFEYSIETKYKKAKTKIFQPEYLITIMMQVFRPEDKERIITMLDGTEIDKNQLMTILKKHHLKEKFDRFIKLYYRK